ncbi:hypothetical protein BGX28_005212 [Mortierella sp. GBA30]|nr:hypothetical protein BGX28_005212 [Mortierella sp. GBA30]
MAIPSVRSMTLAAGTALVLCSTHSAFTTVHADENNDEDEQSRLDNELNARHYRNIENRTRIHLEGSNSGGKSDATNRHHRTAVVAPEEELMPGLVYVALAGLTGSFVARQRSALLKLLSPVAFASAAGYYFLPHTTRNLLGVDQKSFDKWAASHPHSHAHPSSHPKVSQSDSTTTAATVPTASPIKGELFSKAREAWHTAESRVDQLDDKIDRKAENAKEWWTKNTTKVEDGIKDQIHETKSWAENKATEADKALDNAQAKASDAVKSAKGWVEDKTKLVERKFGGSSADADSWPKSQAAGSNSSRPSTEKTWFQHKGDQGPVETRDRVAERKHWWSSRSKSAAGVGVILGAGPGLEADLDSRDHWSDGEEQGTAKVRDSDSGFWFRGTYRRGPEGNLDNKDVDRWSSTGEEMDTAKLDSEPYVRMHRQRVVGQEDLLPRGPEYWSNGEEVSSADIRDANYYSYPGSYKAESLGRASWWSKRSTGTVLDLDSDTSSLKEKAESLVWGAKQAAEKTASDLANRLAKEQSELERRTADIKARAEAAARQARATSDTLIRERQQAMERSAKELEQRIDREKDAADRAAADAKARARDWEIDQLNLVEKTAKEAQERVAREKEAAEATAAQAKAKAEAWARDQKMKADQTAKEVHNRFLRETATAEKAAQEAKAHAEAVLVEKKRSAERASKELADLVARESASKVEREIQLRAQMEELKEELREKHRSTSAGASAGWGRSRSSAPEPTTDWSSSAASSGKRASGEGNKGFDSTGQLLDHIVEDIKQTKTDIEQGLGNLKDAVLGAESKASDTLYKAKETVQETVNKTSLDAASVATGRGTVNLGRNVEKEAVRAEVEVGLMDKAADKNSSETARKAHDNVIDAAADIEGQMLHPHRHHEHSEHESDALEHHLQDHVREDVRRGKEEFQRGMDQVKGAFHGAGHATDKAQANIQQVMDDSQKWWKSKTEMVDQELNQAKDDMEKAAADSKRWWNKKSEKLDQEVNRAAAEGRSWLDAKTREAEDKARSMESELRAGLSKAGDKVRELERGLDETLNPGSREGSNDYWFHVEQSRQQQQQQQQQQRRGSGRAM